MKAETAQAKLAKLLGIEKEHEEFKAKKANLNGDLRGITESEIQSYREVQGLVYFLMAPELYTARVCQRSSCGQPFLVSRKNVAYCSYTCIEKNMEEIWGIKWTYSGDYEDAAVHLYDKNEPLWIRNMDALKKCLDWLTAEDRDQQASVPKGLTFLSLSPSTSSPEKSSSSTASPKTTKPTQPKKPDPMSALNALLSAGAGTT